jgi:hypothetical protein
MKNQDSKAGQKPSRLRKIGRFAKGLWSDSDLWVRFSSFTSGFSLIAEMGVASYFLVAAAPLALAVPGIAGCAVVATAGLFGIYAGSVGTVSRLKSMYKEIFKGQAPGTESKNRKSFLHVMAKFPVVGGVARKLSSAKEKRTKRLSPRKKDIFMSALTLKGGLFGLVTAGFAIVPHVIAGGAATLLTARVILPVLYGAYEGIKTYRGIKVLSRGIFNGKFYKKNKNNPPDETPAPPVQSSPSSVLDNKLSPAFSAEARPESAEQSRKRTPALRAGARYAQEPG